MILVDGQRIDLVLVVAVSLVMIFVFYLITMILLSRFRSSSWRPRSTHATGVPQYDVVFLIPCLNEERVVGASIERLLTFDHPSMRILVIDDGSDDGTADVVRSFDDPRVHLLQRSLPDARKGKGRALNNAVQYLRSGAVIGVPDPETTIVVVVDADGRMDEKSLEYVLPEFDDPELGAAQIGVRINNRHTNLLARFQDFEFVIYTEVFQRGRVILGSSGLGGNGQFVRLAALDALGSDPWSDSLTEDLDLGVRILLAGYRLDFCPDVAVHQQGLVSVKRWVRQRTRWFQGHLQSWGLVPDLLIGLRGSRRLDLYHHLTSPLILLIGSIFSLSFALWMVDLIISLALRTAEFSWFWVGTYLFTFVPSVVLGLIYHDSERSVKLIKTVLISHFYVAYAILWMFAGWSAVFRIILGKNSWAKTERLKENSSGIAEVEAEQDTVGESQTTGSTS